MSMAVKVRTVYADLDGTLLGRGGSLFRTAAGDFTMAGARALELLSRHGVELTPVSGRSVALIREDARLLGAKNHIAEAGCVVVRNSGEEVHKNCAPFGEREDLSVFDEIAATGAPELLTDHFNGVLAYHDPWHRDHEYSHLMRGLVDVDEANGLLAKQGMGELKVVDNGVIEDRGYGLKAEELHAYHIIPRQAGKASAIELDLKLAGCRRQEVVACGDAPQDVEMAAAVRTLYLMANATAGHPGTGTVGIRQAIRDAGHDNIVVVGLPMVEGFLEAIEQALETG